MHTPRRRLFRLAGRVTLLALGGAILNIAVTWLFAMTANPEDQLSFTQLDAAGALLVWNRHATSDLPRGVVDKAWHFRTTGADAINMSIVSLGQNVEGQTTPYMWSLSGFEFGWPRRSLRYTRASPPWRNPRLGAICGCRAPFHLTSSARLISPQIPLCPLWPGFAFNTLLYAALIWLLFATPLALRRRMRRRGLCPRCAYPIGTSAVCTECGALLH